MIEVAKNKRGNTKEIQLLHYLISSNLSMVDIMNQSPERNVRFSVQIVQGIIKQEFPASSLHSPRPEGQTWTEQGRPQQKLTKISKKKEDL